MKKIKIFGMAGLLILIITGIVAIYLMSQNWTIRFKSELDTFFGEGNWECIDEETKDSIIYTDYISVRSNPSMSGEVPGKFKNWYIEFENRNGEEEIWYITNHVLKINHDRYGFFSGKRYSNKQALILELMDISFGMLGSEVYNDIVLDILPEEEAECLEVTMSYHGGNPEPEFYDSLAKEPWFTANEVSAEDFLVYDFHDFYLYIRAYDYRLEKLTTEQQTDIMESMDELTEKILQEYGEDASFEIYLDDEHKVEYTNGERTME